MIMNPDVEDFCTKTQNQRKTLRETSKKRKNMTTYRKPQEH